MLPFILGGLALGAIAVLASSKDEAPSSSSRAPSGPSEETLRRQYREKTRVDLEDAVLKEVAEGLDALRQRYPDDLAVDKTVVSDLERIRRFAESADLSALGVALQDPEAAGIRRLKSEIALIEALRQSTRSGT